LFWFTGVGPGNFTLQEQTPGNGWVITEGANGYTRGTRSGEDQNNFLFGNHRSVDGRMTGGGSVILNGTRVTHGFQVHTDLTRNSRLEVNWGKPNNHFHLSQLTYADGQDNPNISSGQPIAPIDTFVGRGNGLFSGTYNGISYNRVAANVQFTFVDAGEPGINDTADIKVIVLDANKDGSANDSVTVLNTNGAIALTYGNHNAHRENGTGNSTVASIEQQIDVTLNQLDNQNITDDKLTSLTSDLLGLFSQLEIALLA
jgi:hypothetical protein